MVLSNGHPIPVPGFGTFKTPDGKVCVKAVREAVAAGYTHIDIVDDIKAASMTKFNGLL